MEMELSDIVYLMHQYYNIFGINIKLIQDGREVYNIMPNINYKIDEISRKKITDSPDNLFYIEDINKFYYGYLKFGNNILLAGPVCEISYDKNVLERIARKISASEKEVETIKEYIYSVSGIHPDHLLQTLLFFNYIINGQTLNISDLRIKKSEQTQLKHELTKERAVEERSPEYFRKKAISYNIDKEIFEKIKQGNVSSLKKGANKVPALDARQFSDSVLRHYKNFFIRLLTISCFAAVEGGASPAQIAQAEEIYVRKSESLNDIERIKNLQYHMILDMATRVSKVKEYGDSPIVTKVYKYVIDHINENIKIESMAKTLGMSRGYLSNKFHELTGMKLNDYILKQKIESAKLLLTERKMSVIEVSTALGFSSQSYFSRIFKQFTGVSPSKFLEGKEI